MENKTSIDDILNECELKTNSDEIDYNLDSNQIRKNAIDLFLPLPIRLQYLELFYQKESQQFGEIISCLNGMYSFSQTESLKHYLIEIITDQKIPIIFQIECARNLNKEGYFYLNQLCQLKDFIHLPTPIRVDVILYLIQYTKENDIYKVETLQYFCDIINDNQIENLYRLRLIQKIDTLFETKSELFYYFSNESSYQFIYNDRNHIYYRIICCQYIFEKCENYLHIDANELLIRIASDPLINEDLRADACDILLAYGSVENIENARMILFILGGGERIRHNVFKNSQNVHNQSIESSVEKLIEYISNYVPKNGIQYTFEKTKEELEDKIKTHEKYEILKQSMIRITIDRAIYGRLHLTLMNIITKLWTFIQDSEYKEELEKRLLEELIESTNKCSSGYVSRIVNTLSGFCELSVQISFEDQIISVLERRLNKKIEEEDEKDMDLILDEMIIPVRFYDKRGNFLRFFRKHISFIREEMYLEFKDYITDSDYDLYFRKAISHYEGIF